MGLRGKHAQQGAAAVEFAIVLPILIILVFGIIEFSVILFDKAMITNASREGARAGIVYRTYVDPSPPYDVTYDPLDENEIRSIVLNYCQNYLINFGGPSSLTVNVDPASPPPWPTNAQGDPVLRVTVSYQYNFLILPNFITSLAGNLNLVAETVMRMEI